MSSSGPLRALIGLGHRGSRQPALRSHPPCARVPERHSRPDVVSRSRGGNPLRRRPRWLRGRGQSLVEFALVLPVFMLLLLIAVDFGRIFFTNVQLNNAVREAANYGATNPLDTAGMLARANSERNSQSQGGQQDVLTYPANLSTECAAPDGTTIACAASPGGTGAGNTLTVTLTVPFHFFTPFIEGFFNNDLHISTASTVAVLNSAADPGGTNPSGCNGPTVGDIHRSIDRLHDDARSQRARCRTPVCAQSPATTTTSAMARRGVGGTVPTNHTRMRAGDTYTVTLEVTNQGGSADHIA